MALTFPSSPINGAVSGEYTYDATKGAWRKNAALPVSVTHSDVAPSNPRVGDQWWKSNEGTLFTYYNDGTSSQWVESTNVVANVEPNPIPAGAMMAWGSNTVPANWLLCDGSAVSRSTYASLFAIIGTQYGAGDGTTTFNLPNIKGKTIVGKDASQTEFDVLGETGGAKTHTLTESEIPSHTHTGTTSSNGSHTHTVTVGGGAHTHALPLGQQAGQNANDIAYRSGTSNGYDGSFRTGFEASGSSYNSALGTHTHTTSVSTDGAHTHTFTTSAVGGGGAHNNLQPYIVLNYIIKFSAGETPGDSQLATRVGTLETQNNATPISSNYIINGAFDYWQRGTSGTVSANSAAYVSADRYRLIAAGASAPTVTFARSTDVPSGVGIQYSGSFSWSSSAASGDLICAQYIENGKYLFAGKTVTVSFYAKATTAISSIVNFDQDYGNTSFNLTTSWARYSYTITLPSTFATSRPSGTGPNDHTELRFLRFTNAASSSNTIYVTGVQVEEGSYATPFRRSAPSLQSELADCQRYYWRNTAGNYVSLGMGYSKSGTTSSIGVSYPVTMRAVPSSVEFSNLIISDSMNYDLAVSGINQTLYIGTSSSRLEITHGGTATQYRPCVLAPSSGTTGYIAFNAEI